MGVRIAVGTTGAGVVFADERVGEGLVGGHAGFGVDGQAAVDEVAGGAGDAAPVFGRGEGVVGYQDGLHFFQVRVPVEGRVAAEQEVGYYADGPDVAFGSGAEDVSDGWLVGKRVGWGWEELKGVHTLVCRGRSF